MADRSCPKCRGRRVIPNPAWGTYAARHLLDLLPLDRAEVVPCPTCRPKRYPKLKRHSPRGQVRVWRTA